MQVWPLTTFATKRYTQHEGRTGFGYANFSFHWLVIRNYSKEGIKLYQKDGSGFFIYYLQIVKRQANLKWKKKKISEILVATLWLCLIPSYNTTNKQILWTSEIHHTIGWRILSSESKFMSNILIQIENKISLHPPHILTAYTHVMQMFCIYFIVVISRKRSLNQTLA